jgi:hypothetical protein
MKFLIAKKEDKPDFYIYDFFLYAIFFGIFFGTLTGGLKAITGWLPPDPLLYGMISFISVALASKLSQIKK